MDPTYKVKNLVLINDQLLAFKLNDDHYIPELDFKPSKITQLEEFKIDKHGSQLIVFTLQTTDSLEKISKLPFPNVSVVDNDVQILIFQQDSTGKIFAVFPENYVPNSYHVIHFIILDVPNLKLRKISVKKYNKYRQLAIDYSPSTRDYFPPSVNVPSENISSEPKRGKIVDNIFFNNILETNIPLTNDPEINKIILDQLPENGIIELYSINFSIRHLIDRYLVEKIKLMYNVDLLTFPKMNILKFYLKLLLYGFSPRLLNYVAGTGNIKFLTFLMKRKNTDDSIHGEIAGYSYQPLYIFPDVTGANLAVKHKKNSMVEYLSQLDTDLELRELFELESEERFSSNQERKYRSLNVLPDSKGANYAAENEDFDMLQFLYKRNIYPTSSGADKAARQGNVKILKWMYSTFKILPTSYGANKAAANGKINSLDWLENYSIYPSGNFGKHNPVDNRHFKILNWMFSRGINLESISTINVLKNRDVEMLQWMADHNVTVHDLSMSDYNNILSSNDYELKDVDIQIYTILSKYYVLTNLDFPIRYDLTNIINEQRKKGYKFTIKDVNTAAKFGQLHILKWMKQIGELEGTILLPNDNGISAAISNNHVHVLEWLKEMNIYPSVWGFYAAAQKGYLHIFKMYEEYLFSEKTPEDSLLNSTTITEAAKNNHFNVVEYLVNLNIIPDNKSLIAVAANGHLEMLKYLDSVLRKNNLNITEAKKEVFVGGQRNTIANEAAKHNHFHMLQWLSTYEVPIKQSELKWYTNYSDFYERIEKYVSADSVRRTFAPVEKAKFLTLEDKVGIYPDDSLLQYDVILENNNFELISWLANIPIIVIESKIITRPIYPGSYYINEYIKGYRSKEEKYTMINFLLTFMKPNDIFSKDVIRSLADEGFLDILIYLAKIDIYPNTNFIDSIVRSYEHHSGNVFRSSYNRTHYFNLRSVLHWLVDQKVIFEQKTINIIIKTEDVLLLKKVLKDHVINVDIENINDLRTMQYLIYIRSVILRRPNELTLTLAKRRKMNILKYLFNDVINVSNLLNSTIIKIIDTLITNNYIQETQWFLDIMKSKVKITFENKLINTCIDFEFVDSLRIINNYTSILSVDNLKYVIIKNKFNVLRLFVDLEGFPETIKYINQHDINSTVNNYHSLDIIRLLAKIGIFLDKDGLNLAVSAGNLDILKFIYNKYPRKFKLDFAADNAAVNGKINVLEWLNEIYEKESSKKIKVYDGKYIPSRNIIYPVINERRWNVLKWLIDRGYTFDIKILGGIKKVLTNVNLFLIELLIARGYVPTQEDVDYVASKTEMQLIKLFYEKFNMIPNVEAIDSENHLEILRWIDDLGKEGQLEEDYYQQIHDRYVYYTNQNRKRWEEDYSSDDYSDEIWY